jgi:hypothetical protein
LFTPAIVWNSSNDGMAAVDSSIEGARGDSMEVATTIKVIAAKADVSRRIVGPLC